MPGIDKMKKLQGMMRGRDRAVVLPGETGMTPVKGKKKNRLKEAAKKRMELRKKTKRNMMQRRMRQKSAGY